MKWSKIAWSESRPVYDKILEHPFVLELMKGVLEHDKFLFYICQDALYLNSFSKALAGIAAKLDRPEHSEAFVGFAGENLAVERELHQSFFKAAKVDMAADPSPSCLLYTSYMLRHLYESPVEVAAASVLPCFWVYKEVGDHMLEQRSTEDNIYQSWIDTYGGEEYGKTVRRAVQVCDELAAAASPALRKLMTRAFVTSTRMEWMFWDSAYRLEGWAV